MVGSIPKLKPYTAIKGMARAQRRHHIQTIMRELLVDAEANVVESGGGLYVRFAGQDEDEDPHVVRAIGLWAGGRRSKLSIRQMLALPREGTRHDLAEARTGLTPYSTTTYAINGPNIIERRFAATATVEDIIFTQLKIAETLGELQVETEKIWILIYPDATALWLNGVASGQPHQHFPPPPSSPSLLSHPRSVYIESFWFVFDKECTPFLYVDDLGI